METNKCPMNDEVVTPGISLGKCVLRCPTCKNDKMQKLRRIRSDYNWMELYSFAIEDCDKCIVECPECNHIHCINITHITEDMWE
jgi:hypothetical protein